ncbi:hypothetical protein [Nostoc sp. NZL]|uniref:hypothetical protein n=1 Tax=Nostoc sp. NZL TaxID=2650612 RepID=UPI0018C79F23|nr:hypothetical protein [Nostoc sp. NZL]MBG1242070.1 hypothetical protein [Nostoc sp. NZL]
MCHFPNCASQSSITSIAILEAKPIAPLPNPDNLSAIASHPNSQPLVRKNQRTNHHRRSQLLWLN